MFKLWKSQQAEGSVECERRERWIWEKNKNRPTVAIKWFKHSTIADLGNCDKSYEDQLSNETNIDKSYF